MSEARIIEWYKVEGEPVQAGDTLFTFETDKANVDVESPVSGILGKILVRDDETASSATVVGLIFEEGKVRSSPAAKRLAKKNDIDITTIQGTGRNGRITIEDVQQVINKGEDGPVKSTQGQQLSPKKKKVVASPIAKRLAKAHGIDLTSITGTGKGGRIIQDDVQNIIEKNEQSKPVSPKSTLIPIEGIRATIAERMSLSVQQSAQVTLHSEVDATNLINLRQAYKLVAPSADITVPGYNALLITIVAQALREYPQMNARQEGEAIRLLDDVNIGIAVDTERGLLVVSIKDADRKSVLTVDSELAALAERARLGTSSLGDLTGSTFTITNLGVFGIDQFTPIINPPEIGILGIGRIIEKPMMMDGEVVGRPMITLSLTFDHRLIDGAPAARFLQRIAQLIEKGE